MNFDPILYGPLFVRDASDVNLVASGADPVEVTVASGGSSWPLPVTPVLAGGQYIAPLRMREILSSVVDIPGLAAAGVREVPLVTLSAGGASMSFRVVYGSAAGRTPAQLAGHWLTWRDQISKTQTWGRERLTFLAGLDLLGWQSGSYSVSAKVFFASGDPETVTLASGTLQSGCRYVTVDASYAVIAAAVQSAGNITAWDVSYAFSGVTTGGSAASVDGYPLRLVVARQDVRVKEFIFCNSFGVEDRVYSSGRSNPKVEGTSVAFLSGGTESELRNDAEEGKEVYSGHISSARDGALWTDFLKARDRHILLSGALEQIVVDSHETDFQDNAIGSVKFTYHLSKLDAGRFFQDAEGLGDYDPGQQYGALYVGDDPAAEELPSEDLFFLKTRLDEFPAADLTEELLFLVQNPLTQAWGNAPLSALKNWLQEAVSARQTPVWSGPWADYSAGVADYALAASLGRDLYDRIQNIEQNPYNLPVASDTVLGGIRVGANLSIDAAGVLSASAVQPGDLKSLTLKVDTATVGSYTPTAANTLTITAQHLYDAIGREKYHPFGGEHDDNTEKTFYIGGALFTWHPASDNTPGYLELNSAFLTGGDQIVNNGTPGQGGGSGGAGYLYELGDIFHKYTNAQSQEVDANAVLRPQSYWTNPTTPVVAQNNDLLIKTSSGWAAIPQSSITTDLTNYYTKSETDSEISSAISALNLGAAATYGIGSVASGNTGLVTGGAVYSYVNDVVSSALKFQGTTTTAISDGSTTNPITINSQSYTAKKGDVVLYDGKEYLWTGSAWEQLGDEASWALKTTTISAGTGLTGGGTLAANRTISLSQATIDSLALADSAYQKPSGGIPKTDLASAVQTSLGLADTAYQKPNGGIPNSDIATPWVKVGTTQINLGGQQTSLAGLVNVTMTGKLTIGSAEITWVEGVGGADGYLKISTALVTEGDQIVNSGTPGGGGSAGSSYLYELLDVTIPHGTTHPSNGEALIYRNGYWVNEALPAGTTYTAGTGITISEANAISVTANTYAPYNSAGYLPLSAGSTKALTDALYVSAGNVYNLYLNNTASDATTSGIRFQTGGTTQGAIYVSSDHGLYFNDNTANRTVYHSGNAYISSSSVTIGSNTVGSSASPIGYATTATNANYLNRNNTPVANVFQYASGQLTVGSSAGNAYEGSSNNHSLWSYPAGGTSVTSGKANVQTIRLGWSSGTTYWHDIFVSPNQAHFWHRHVNNGTAGAWAKFLDTANYSATLGSVYHPLGGATDQAFVASTIGTNGNITMTGADRTISMGASGSEKSVLRLTSSYLLVGNGTYTTLPTIIYGTPIRLYTYDGSNGNEWMRITSDGKVGIGVSAPTARLSIVRNSTTGTDTILTAQNDSFNTATYGYAAAFTGSAMIADSKMILLIGKALSAKNSAYFGYHHVADASNDNYATIGLYSANELVNISAAGNVAIGTTPQSYKLYVNGTSYLNGNATIPTGKTLTIGGATISWVAPSGSTPGYLKINTALLTEGDQIVNSGTPGGGGSGGGASYLYELKDFRASQSRATTSAPFLLYRTAIGSTSITGNDGNSGAWTYASASEIKTALAITTSDVSGISNYLTTATAASTYLPLAGGTVTGTINRRLSADTSNYVAAITWIKNANNDTIASIGYHNTVQKVFINPIGSASVYSDAVGKYSLVIGNNVLTYNTKVILREDNYTSYVNTTNFPGLNSTGTVTAVAAGTRTNADKLAITASGSTSYITVPYATHSNYLDVVPVTADAQLVTGGVRAYQGPGQTSWDGVSTMNYAGILSFGTYTRGWQLWAARGDTGFYFRNGLQDATGWADPRLIYDSYTLTATVITTKLGYTPVNKAGDTMTGALIMNYPGVYGIYTNNSASGGTASGIRFQVGGTTKGAIYVSNASALYFNDGTSDRTVWHSGNSNLSTVNWAAKALTLAGALSGATTGSFSSDVTVGGDLILSTNNKAIRLTDKPASGTGTTRTVLYLDTSNNLALGYGTAHAGYPLYIDGNEIYLRYSSSHTKGITLNSSGNVTIGGSDLASSNYKLYVDGGTYLSALLTVNGHIRPSTNADDTTVTDTKTIGSSSLYFASVFSNKIYLGTNSPALVLYGINATRYSIYCGNPSTEGNGTHGSVTGSFAEYFTMYNAANRGWIFQLDNGTTRTNVFSISAGGYVTANASISAASFIASNSSGSCQGLTTTSATGYWSYIRLINKDTSTNYWDIGTLDSTSTAIAQANAFEIRNGRDSSSGISIRNNTSSYGKLVVRVPSGQCSIGYWSTDDNPVSGYPIWTAGYAGDTDKVFGWYYRGSSDSGWKMSISPSGDLTHTGVFNTSKINLRRSSGVAYGRISYYSPAYYTWFTYMSNAASGASPTGATPPTGTYVTGWALRSLIEASSGMGWTWESCANGENNAPAIKMELSSNTGNLKVYGSLDIGSSSLANLNFQRASACYITAPASGYFCFVPNGGATSIATSSLIVNDTAVYSGKSGVALGTSSYPWAGGYFNRTIYVNAGSSGTATGIALWGTSTITTYGIYMATTANYGTHGGVTSSGAYATYFQMNNTAGRGWIWRSASTCVASINVAGLFTTNGDQVISSDASLKKDWRPLNYGIADIAKATAGVFTWKDGRGISAGTKAQDWEKLVPQLVHGDEGHKTLAYGQVAMLNTILLARGYESHEERIKRLEAENMEFKKEIEQLRAN